MERKHISSIALTLLILLLLAPLYSTVIPIYAQAEHIETNKSLYAVVWSDEKPLGYVNITVMYSGLDPTQKYKIQVDKVAPPSALIPAYAREVYGSSTGKINFTIPPTMNAKPQEIAGTYKAAIYDVAGNLLKNCTFGVWSINARKLNYGRIIQIWGGGAYPNSTVTLTVNGITSTLFGSSPVVCKADTNGVFSNSSIPIPPTVTKANYTVTLTSYLAMDQEGKPEENTQLLEITDRLLVNIISPVGNYRRTETLPLEVEVLYCDYTPVISGSVNMTLFNGTILCTLSYNAPTLTWKGSYKTFPCNATGNFTVVANARDSYTNVGSDTDMMTLLPAVLVVESVVPPQPVVPRATWVSWQIKVTYKGDGSLVANLNPAASAVYVVNATTLAVVGSAGISKISDGMYNVTWFVPAAAALGSYKFKIPAGGLVDACGNSGPENATYSDAFAVVVTTLVVVADTYQAVGGTVKKAFVPGDTVHIGAKVTYADSGAIMAYGTVSATVQNTTWTRTYTMTFNGTNRMWWYSLVTTGMTAGRYEVVITARDLGDNTGVGSTYFLLAGFVITPNNGTVPPEKCLTITKIGANTYLVEATIYTDPVSGKSLGTAVDLTGVGFTPNSKVNVTVSGLPNYNTSITPTSVMIVLMNVAVGSEGGFTASFVFPTAPNGTYTITAKDAKGVTKTTTFTVIPGLILTPGEVVGSALINVIGTGFPVGVNGSALLVDGTDALVEITAHVDNWAANTNGTIASSTVSGIPAKPAFVLPFIEPKTYTITLYMGTSKTKASDTVKVVNDIKEITTILEDSEEIKDIVEGMKEVVVEEIAEGVVAIKTDVGYVRATVDDLVKALNDMNVVISAINANLVTLKSDVGTIVVDVKAIKPVVTEIKDGVATVKTEVGTLKGKVETIDGSVATVKTDVGTIKADVSNIKTTASAAKSSADAATSAANAAKSSADAATSAANAAKSAADAITIPVYIAIILALIAAIASIYAVVTIRRKIAG
jgi:hypothetical protein